MYIISDQVSNRIRISIKGYIQQNNVKKSFAKKEYINVKKHIFVLFISLLS